MPSRREAMITGAAAIALPAAIGIGPRQRFLDAIHGLEHDIGAGARIGVALVDPVTGRNVGWRSTERFPMCSTFKLLVVGQTLQRVDRGIEHLARLVPIPAKVLPNSPVTGKYAGGVLPVRDLCSAAMTQSDNTAANLLLQRVGGPAALTQFLRASGDAITRLDRYETELNEGTPGDPRDTTTPTAMLATMRRLTVGAILTPPSRKQLMFWMANTLTGADKLKKNLPAGWTVGDRTGAGGHNTNNDIALIWPAKRDPRRPLFVTSYITGGPGDDALSRNPVQAKIGELIVGLIGAA